MGRKSTNKARIDNPGIKADWIKRLMPSFMRGELHHQTMEIIARKAGVSKATFYKHYASKDAVLLDVLDLKISQISVFAQQLFNHKESFTQRYFNALHTVTNELAGISNDFLMYLKTTHPELWEKIDDLIRLGIQSMSDFYKSGIQEEVLEDINTDTLAVMDHIFINALSDPQILIENNITLETFIEQYFLVKSRGIFKDRGLGN